MRSTMTAIGACLLLASCASTRMKDAMSELQDSVEAYNEAFRWKNFERAAMFMPADLRGAFLATYEDDDKDLHVEDYQIIDVHMENEKSAIVRVRMRYMMLPSVTVEKAALVQHWKKINDAWTLETEEGSVRELAVDKKPRNPEAAVKDAPEADPAQKDGIEVTDPKGKTLRKEGSMSDDEDDDSK